MTRLSQVIYKNRLNEKLLKMNTVKLSSTTVPSTTALQRPYGYKTLPNGGRPRRLVAPKFKR